MNFLWQDQRKMKLTILNLMLSVGSIWFLERFHFSATQIITIWKQVLKSK